MAAAILIFAHLALPPLLLGLDSGGLYKLIIYVLILVISLYFLMPPYERRASTSRAYLTPSA